MRDEAGATFVTRSLSSAFAVRMVKATVATASTDAIGKSRFHDMSCILLSEGGQGDVRRICQVGSPRDRRRARNLMWFESSIV